MRRLPPQNQKGYVQNRPFKRFCKRGHDRLAPYGMTNSGKCRKCKEMWDRAYVERIRNAEHVQA